MVASKKNFTKNDDGRINKCLSDPAILNFLPISSSQMMGEEFVR